MGGCVLLNAATAFWPAWMNQLLPDGWWTCRSRTLMGAAEAIQSWVVRDDPLSEGTPGGARAPRTPGTTIVLPACAKGLALIENHAFAHFVAPLPRSSVGEGADEDDDDDGFISAEGED